MVARSRGRRRSATPAAPPRKARRSRLETISPDQAEAIFAAVLDVLHRVGMWVEDEEARRMLAGAGARCDDGKVFYPPDLVRRAIETIPPRITFFSQNGATAFATDDHIPRFGAAANCVQVLDPRDRAYRACLLSDIADHGRLQQALPHIDIAASLGYPSDVDAETEALASARALMDTTSKPIFFTGHDEHGVKAIWEDMGQRAGGMDQLAAKPFGLDLVGPVSPLKLSGETCQRLLMAARLNLPVVCYPAIFPGMACPLTLAGAITQATAESLAGIVISQLANPGAPVMSGSSVMPMDMRRADMAIGAPEYTLAGLGAADVFCHLNIPCWVGSGCTDAHDIGPQAFAEASASLHGTCVAGTALTHNLGVLSSGRTGSMEMLVACDELAAMASQFGAGIEVSPETIAVDVIARASGDNSFLTDPHTLARYETEMWIPGLLRREGIENWQEAGQPDLAQRLREKTLDLLESL
ncbi:MAG: trimethylamine methyltransferase family protein [Sedimentitalea sp.]